PDRARHPVPAPGLRPAELGERAQPRPDVAPCPAAARRRARVRGAQARERRPPTRPLISCTAPGQRTGLPGAVASTPGAGGVPHRPDHRRDVRGGPVVTGRPGTAARRRLRRRRGRDRPVGAAGAPGAAHRPDRGYGELLRRAGARRARVLARARPGDPGLRRGPRRAAVWGVAVIGVIAATGLPFRLLAPGAEPLVRVVVDTLFDVSLLAVLLLLGETLRSRAAVREEAELRLRLAEQERRQRVTEERLRIAGSARRAGQLDHGGADPRRRGRREGPGARRRARLGAAVAVRRVDRPRRGGAPRGRRPDHAAGGPGRARGGRVRLRPAQRPRGGARARGVAARHPRPAAPGGGADLGPAPAGRGGGARRGRPAAAGHRALLPAGGGRAGAAA